MKYKVADVRKYLLALDYISDTEVGHIEMFCDPNGN